MGSIILTPYQLELVQKPIHSKIFIEGPAGCGKTTVGIHRCLALLESGIPASSILLLVPQRTLAVPYQEALRSPEWTPGKSPGRRVEGVTVGGLAKRMVELFWPLIGEEAGFIHPDQPPSFLTLESSLYYMAYLVRPLLDEGLFDSVTIERSRIYSQILDNLNKAAIVGFPYTEIGARLKGSWIESTAQANVFQDAQRCASLFREYCLENNLLDFSLQIEVFTRLLWPSMLCREYLQRMYSHLVADNLEEDNPVAHDLLREWLPEFESAFLIMDRQGGFRRFLGADPLTAEPLCSLVDERYEFTEPMVTSEALRAFSNQLGLVLERGMEEPKNTVSVALSSEQLHAALNYPAESLRFYPQMLDWVVNEVDALVRGGTAPKEIVILAPLLPDSLRFALANRLENRKIPTRSHRPSRSLRDEPAAQALLTLAGLAHPQWKIKPSAFEVAYTLIQAIQDLDLVRAQLLVQAATLSQGGRLLLQPFDTLKPEMRERITYRVGLHYERLRRWLEGYASLPEVELDFFFSRLFGEVLSQKGFGFHTNLDAGRTCANLIESAHKFRLAVKDRLPPFPSGEGNSFEKETSLGSEYIAMIQEGVLAAQYIESWQIPSEDGVLLAPAYTFLLANQPVDHQFWLDIGSNTWYERLLQPLTHPQVLTREWPRDRVWTDVDEYEYARDTLYRLALGLIRRCRKRVHLGLSDLNEGGYESRGIFLRAIQVLLRQSRGYTPAIEKRGER